MKNEENLRAIRTMSRNLHNHLRWETALDTIDSYKGYIEDLYYTFMYYQKHKNSVSLFSSDILSAAYLITTMLLVVLPSLRSDVENSQNSKFFLSVVNDTGLWSCENCVAGRRPHPDGLCQECDDACAQLSCQHDGQDT